MGDLATSLARFQIGGSDHLACTHRMYLVCRPPIATGTFKRGCIPNLGMMHTFKGVASSVWKAGAKTIFETSSRPFSVALPILDIGVRRLIHRDVLVLADSEASKQIRWTKETGSTGSRTLKNSTV